jgi:hypothetical protein
VRILTFNTSITIRSYPETLSVSSCQKIYDKFEPESHGTERLTQDPICTDVNVNLFLYIYRPTIKNIAEVILKISKEISLQIDVDETK